MELPDYLRVLRAHWVGVLLLTLLGAVLAAGYSYSQPKVYAADASGFVTTARAGDAAPRRSTTRWPSRAPAPTSTSPTSRAVAELVIDNLGLDTTPATLVE